MRTVCLGVWLAAVALGQATAPVKGVAAAEPPDAERTKQEFHQLLDHYPPALKRVLALDPALMANQAYLAPYPGVVAFLGAHPEIARNPGFYVDEVRYERPDPAGRAIDLWKDVLGGLAAFIAFGMAISVIVWLIRTLVDYRRWSRLSKVQTDVHTKLLDRFTSNEDLMAYIQSPAGAKFLQSTPILLDAGPRTVAAPLGRILWSLQGGVVLLAAGIGLMVIAARVPYEAGQPLQAMGVLAIALGAGFMISAAVSFFISRRLGLIETAKLG